MKIYIRNLGLGMKTAPGYVFSVACGDPLWGHVKSALQLYLINKRGSIEAK